MRSRIVRAAVVLGAAVVVAGGSVTAVASAGSPSPGSTGSADAVPTTSSGDGASAVGPTGPWDGTRVQTAAGTAYVTDLPAVRAPSAADVPLDITVLDDDGELSQFAVGGIADVSGATTTRLSIEIDGGQRRVRVPPGTYAGYFQLFDGPDQVFAPLAEFVVPAGGGSLTVDARDADAEVTVTTPRALESGSVGYTFRRVDALGRQVFQIASSVDIDQTFRVAPVPEPEHGSLLFNVGLVGQTAAGYGYDVAFSSPEVSPDQARRVRAAQVTTVTETHAVDRAGKVRVWFQRYANYPGSAGFYPQPELTVPRTRTVGIFSDPPVSWLVLERQIGTSDPSTLGATVTYEPGASVRESWRQGPMGPALLESSTTCVACRTDTTMTLLLAPFADRAGHQGILAVEPVGPPNVQLLVQRDGVTVARATNRRDSSGISGVPVPAAQGDYRVVYDVDRYRTGATTSTRSHTEVTFTSVAGEGPAAPAGLACPGAPAGETCRALPMLWSTVDVPVDDQGHLSSGPVEVTVDLGRVDGAEPADIDFASVSLHATGQLVSLASARLTPAGDGRFTATLRVPRRAVGLSVDVEVVATDTDSGRIEQRLDRVALVGPPAG